MVPGASQRHSALTEGLAVGALVHGRVGFMGAYQNPVQRAVVLVLAMMGALLDGAFDTFVGMTVHSSSSFDLKSGYSMANRQKRIQEKVSNLAFWKNVWYF